MATDKDTNAWHWHPLLILAWPKSAYHPVDHQMVQYINPVDHQMVQNVKIPTLGTPKSGNTNLRVDL